MCTNYGTPSLPPKLNMLRWWENFAANRRNNLIWLPFKSFEECESSDLFDLFLILSAKFLQTARTVPTPTPTHLNSTAVMNCWKFILPQGLSLLLFDDARGGLWRMREATTDLCQAKRVSSVCLFELNLKSGTGTDTDTEKNSLINWSILKGQQTWHGMPGQRIGMPQMHCTDRLLKIVYKGGKINIYELRTCQRKMASSSWWRYF